MRTGIIQFYTVLEYHWFRQYYGDSGKRHRLLI